MTENLVTDYGFSQCVVVLHCDSSSALHVATNKMTHGPAHGRVKHIDVRYHFIRNNVS